MMRRGLGVLGLASLLAAACLLIAGRLLPVLASARYPGTAAAKGQVIGFADEAAARPLISFVAPDGVPYVFEAEETRPGPAIGELVNVRYSLDPELKAYLAPDLLPLRLALSIPGCGLAAAGLALLLIQWRRASLRKQLLQYGTRFTAVVRDIVPPPHPGRSLRPYVVTCGLKNPQGLGEWTLKSPRLRRLPASLQAGLTVPVLVDLCAPNHYLLLLEEAAPPEAC